jgi:hypothetical protein
MKTFLNKKLLKMDPPLSDQILPFFKPNYDCLSVEETYSALNKNLIAFPEVIRYLTDPQKDGDSFVLLSFLKSNEHCYVKVRGYGNLDTCKDKAKEIIKSVDSRLPIAIARLGQWCYVTSEPNLVSKETIKLIDDKEVSHKEHVEILISEHERTTKKVDDEINERDVKDAEIKDDLASYIREKVMIYETYKQIQFLTSKLNLLKERQSLLIAINKELAEKYESLWYDEYMAQLATSGIKSTNITPEKISQIEEENRELLVGDRKRLKEVEKEYNNLRYSAVEF